METNKDPRSIEWLQAFRRKLITYALILVLAVGLPVVGFELQRPWNLLDQLITQGKIVLARLSNSFDQQEIERMNRFALKVNGLTGDYDEDYLIWSFNLLVTEGALPSEQEMKATLKENDAEPEDFDYQKLSETFGFWRNLFNQEPGLLELFQKYKQALIDTRNYSEQAGFIFVDDYVMVDDSKTLVFLLDSLEWYESSYPGLYYDVVENDCVYFRDYLKNGPGYDTDPRHYHLGIFPKFNTDQWGTWFSVWLAKKNNGVYNNFSIDFSADKVKRMMWTLAVLIAGISAGLLLIISLIARQLGKIISAPIEKAFMDMRRLDEMKDNFLSMVSHDLRTPMTSIKGYAKLLIEKINQYDEDRQLKYLNIIIKESDRLTRLINNLLDLQRFEAGKTKFPLENVELNGVISESMEAFGSAADDKRILLEKSGPEGAVTVYANRDRLLQVMANYLSNAIKFNHEGGRIRISLERIKADAGEEVKVTVTDTGPGIPKDQQSRLFSKFQQVEEMARTKGQGSGLGLALVREIVEFMQGRVGLESEVGKGSSFYFILKAKAQGEVKND